MLESLHVEKGFCDSVRSFTFTHEPVNTYTSSLAGKKVHAFTRQLQGSYVGFPKLRVPFWGIIGDIYRVIWGTYRV